MPTQFPELRFSQLQERLLRAGIAPRHVRRYLSELSDHLADLTAEQQRAGLSLPDARTAALARLGTTDTLADAMTSQPHAQSLTARAPWAAFALAPLLSLATLWCISLSVLWLGWQHFMPGTASPFGHRPGPHNLLDLSNLYFQLDRALYYAAPLLIGWTTAIVAARQRFSPLWPAAGLALIAILSSTAQVYAISPSSPASTGAIRINFAVDPSIPSLVTGIIRVLIVLCILMLPYFAERLRTRQPLAS
jgi:hypothetical protein